MDLLSTYPDEEYMA